MWSCGAWGCRPTVECPQWCGERGVWATRGLLRLRGPRVVGSRHLGRAVAPVSSPRAVSGGVWLRCIVSTVGGGAICSGVGWARGRLPAGSGCRGLTVGGSSAVSPWCVPWWSLVGWLKGAFGVYRIHGGTIVCWGAAAVGAASCGGGACVGVVRVVGGGVLCVVLGGFSWWSVVVVPGGWSWAWRFLGGCGTCGVGLARGGGGARVWACVFAFCSPRGLFLCLSLAPLFSLACLSLFLLFFFFLSGGAGWGAVRGCGCVPVPAPVWAWVSWGTGVGWLLRSRFPVCAPAPRLDVPRAPVRGALTAGGWRQWWRGACVGGRGSWVVPGGRGRAWACVWVCPRRGLMGFVGSVGVVGLCGCRVCVRQRRSGLSWGTVGDAMGGGDAGDAYGGVLWASKRVCVVDVGASGDAPDGDGVGDADGVIGDGAGAGGPTAPVVAVGGAVDGGVTGDVGGEGAAGVVDGEGAAGDVMGGGDVDVGVAGGVPVGGAAGTVPT